MTPEKSDGAKPVSENERSDRLSRDEIVEVALRMTRRVGLDGLTMRGLAEELGVTPMAAYYYVPNKESLLELVADSVRDRLPPIDPTSGPWDEVIRRHALAVFDTLSKYPGVGLFLLDRPLTENGRNNLRVMIELLRSAGFDNTSALLAYSTYHTYMYGRMAIEGQARARRRAAGRNRRSDSTTSGAGFPDAASLTGLDFVTFGIDSVLDGLRAQLARIQDAASAGTANT